MGDHFYYMSTKGAADGAVHRYFSPFESPYDAFIAYMNVLKDISRRSEVGQRDDLMSSCLTDREGPRIAVRGDRPVR